MQIAQRFAGDAGFSRDFRSPPKGNIFIGLTGHPAAVGLKGYNAAATAAGNTSKSLTRLWRAAQLFHTSVTQKIILADAASFSPGFGSSLPGRIFDGASDDPIDVGCGRPFWTGRAKSVVCRQQPRRLSDWRMAGPKTFSPSA
jgi:hypothetical protein